MKSQKILMILGIILSVAVLGVVIYIGFFRKPGTNSDEDVADALTAPQKSSTTSETTTI